MKSFKIIKLLFLMGIGVFSHIQMHGQTEEPKYMYILLKYGSYKCMEISHGLGFYNDGDKTTNQHGEFVVDAKADEYSNYRAALYRFPLSDVDSIVFTPIPLKIIPPSNVYVEVTSYIIDENDSLIIEYVKIGSFFPKEKIYRGPVVVDLGHEYGFYQGLSSLFGARQKTIGYVNVYGYMLTPYKQIFELQRDLSKLVLPCNIIKPGDTYYLYYEGFETFYKRDCTGHVVYDERGYATYDTLQRVRTDTFTFTFPEDILDWLRKHPEEKYYIDLVPVSESSALSKGRECLPLREQEEVLEEE